MRAKKPILKIIQIGTLFVLTSISFLGLISFSNPEISSFWSVKKISFNLSTPVFADHDDDEDDEEDKEEEKNKDEREDDRDHDDKEKESPSIPVKQNPVIPPVINNPVSNSGSTNNCKTIIETVYDTVTSASGTTSQVPRQVTNQVCDTPTITPTPTTPTPVVETPAITKPVEVVKIPITNPINTINNIYNDGTYSGVGKYLYAGGSVDYSVEIVILGGKITSAKFLNFMASGNGKYTQIQGESILAKIVSTQNSTIDTVSGASGTSKAIQDAVDNALSKAKNTNTNPKKDNTGSVKKIIDDLFPKGLSDEEKTEISNLIDKILSTLTREEKIDELNDLSLKTKKLIVVLKVSLSKLNNESDLLDLDNKINIYEDILDIISSKKSKLQIKEVLLNKKINTYSYKAPNLKTYTIIDNGEIVRVKKSDGSYAKQDFKTYNEAISYLNKNAIPPKKVATQSKKVIVTTTSKVIPKTTTKPVTKVVIPTTVVTKPVVSTPKKTTITKPVTPTPVVTKPVVNTTTKAS